MLRAAAAVGRTASRAAAVANAPRAAAGLGPRCFAASPLEATSKAYDELVAKAVKEYQANQKTVAGDLDAEIASNRMVLLMEGSPDAPKSEASLNAVKMLTQVQAVPLMAVDTLSHPALLGYAVTKTQRNRGPYLFVDGSFYADHDGLLAKFKTGELAKAIGTEATRSTGVFGGELPVATY
uniref:Glutaredoxin domain-containing protein n=1 Tax=Zooxanthella nutricula TaxID=1333877 RepID=A0A7S2LQE4_9DINO